MKTLGHPQYGKSQKRGRVGEMQLSLFVTKNLGWIFRSTNQENDFGIDGFIEVIEESNVTGLSLATQVKCGSTYINQRSEDGIKYYGENKHLNYYLNIGCPIILIVFNENATKGYWVEFDISKTEKTNKGWWQEIPFSNSLDNSVKEKWRALLPETTDYSEHIETLWRTNEHMDKSAICSYVIDRQGLEELDFTSLNQLIKQLTRNKKVALENRNKLHVTFLGYDDDPREVFEIPEIRCWYMESLKKEIPWFYLLSPEYNGMEVIIFLFSCCDIKVINKSKAETTIEIMRFDDIGHWLTTNFNSLNKFTDANNISEEINIQVSELIHDIVNGYLFSS